MDLSKEKAQNSSKAEKGALCGVGTGEVIVGGRGGEGYETFQKWGKLSPHGKDQEEYSGWWEEPLKDPQTSTKP